MNNKHWQITFSVTSTIRPGLHREAGRLIRQYMAERNVDYKTATHKLQGIVKDLSNEGSFRSYAAQEPLVRKHYEASKTIDERANVMAKKPVLSIPTRFGTPAAWRLKLRRFTSVEPLSYEQVYGTSSG